MNFYKCEKCGTPKDKLHPAGKNKVTGKAYKEFYICPTCVWKPSDKPKTSTLEEKCRVKFLEIDERLKHLEDLAYNIGSNKGLPNATSESDEQTSEQDLPF